MGGNICRTVRLFTNLERTTKHAFKRIFFYHHHVVASQTCNFHETFSFSSLFTCCTEALSLEGRASMAFVSFFLDSVVANGPSRETVDERAPQHHDDPIPFAPLLSNLSGNKKFRIL